MRIDELAVPGWPRQRVPLLQRLALSKSICRCGSCFSWPHHPPARGPRCHRRRVLRDAIARGSCPWIEDRRGGHMAQRKCFACHHQAIPLLALTTARAHGLGRCRGGETPEFIVRFLDGARRTTARDARQGGQADTAGYALWQLEMGQRPPDATTAAVAEYLLLRQSELGYWKATSNRPPSEASSFTTSYLALRACRPSGLRRKRKGSKNGRRRGDWLVKTPARDTEDRVFRLWGMHRWRRPQGN